MGSSSYSTDSRTVRASVNYASNIGVNEIFTQNKKREIHPSMEPKQAKLRESRDSVIHPCTVPIILALDVTGSMRKIPEQLIREGLPKMISGIIEGGIPDPALLFLAIGDTEYDHYPLQVGQFESGDLELDTWLTRTYLEGGGGGNNGESYLLAWYYAAFHTITDAWEKRKQKGFLFTVGDEPTLDSLPANVVEGLMNEKIQSGLTTMQLIAAASKNWNIYHLHVTETPTGARAATLEHWRELLGQSVIRIDDHKEIPGVIARIVQENTPKDFHLPNSSSNTMKPSEEML